MSLLIASILAFAATAYDGDGILNLVVVGKDYKIQEIKEIKYFTALSFEGKGDLSFILVLNGDARLDHPDGGPLPTLILLKNSQIVASVHLRVSRSEKDNEVILQWSAVPDFDEDSHCFIQMYPNSEEMVSLKIPFSAATVKRAEKGRSAGEPLETMTWAQFREVYASAPTTDKTREDMRPQKGDDNTEERDRDGHSRDASPNDSGRL